MTTRQKLEEAALVLENEGAFYLQLCDLYENSDAKPAKPAKPAQPSGPDLQTPAGHCLRIPPNGTTPGP